MKRKLILSLTILVVCVLFVPALAGADEWQTATLWPISFQVPADWQMVEERMGLSEQEMGWFLGDFHEPKLSLAVAYAEEAAMFLDIIIMGFDEDVDVLFEGTIQILGKEGRLVSLFNRTDRTYGSFIAVEEVTPAGEDVLLLIGSIEEEYQAFEPIQEQILASFTLID